jgi:hypothetical protein
MAILLDSFHNGDRGPRRFRHQRCGHLVSDTSLDELHEFAGVLGLRREWLHRKSIPHYDLTGEVYDRALAHGATLVSSRELVRRAVRLSLTEDKFSPLPFPLLPPFL